MRASLPAKKSVPGHSRVQQGQAVHSHQTVAQPVRPAMGGRMIQALHPAGGALPATGQCACGAQGGGTGECAACRAQRLRSSGQQVQSARQSVHGQTEPGRTRQDDESAVHRVVVVGQTTPDGTTLGPTDPTHRTCLASNRLIWSGGAGQNTATAATGRSRVTAHLGSAPGDGTDCECGCGLFRQYIRGFWRTGSPSAPKQHNIGSCGNTITISENAWTEEFEACNPGGAPLSAACDRVYLDAPGFSAGLADGTFAQVHFDLRYQMWDQCRGRPIATGDRSLRIRGDRSPRLITFS